LSASLCYCRWNFRITLAETIAMILHNQRKIKTWSVSKILSESKHIGWKPLISSRVQEQSAYVHFSLELFWLENQSDLRPSIIWCLTWLSSHFLAFALRAYCRLMHFDLIHIYHDSFPIIISTKDIDQHFPNPTVSPSAKSLMYICLISKSGKKIFLCHSCIEESNYRINE
jgi:hypothetical protein